MDPQAKDLKPNEPSSSPAESNTVLSTSIPPVRIPYAVLQQQTDDTAMYQSDSVSSMGSSTASTTIHVTQQLKTSNQPATNTKSQSKSPSPRSASELSKQNYDPVLNYKSDNDTSSESPRNSDFVNKKRERNIVSRLDFRHDEDDYDDEQPPTVANYDDEVAEANQKHEESYDNMQLLNNSSSAAANLIEASYLVEDEDLNQEVIKNLNEYEAGKEMGRSRDDFRQKANAKSFVVQFSPKEAASGRENNEYGNESEELEDEELGGRDERVGVGRGVDTRLG